MVDGQRREVSTLSNYEGDVESLIKAVSNRRFQDWFEEIQTAENVLNGQAYFNSPAPPKDSAQHTPSQLLQCKRKISYRRNNAPKEGDQPDGIFFVGNTVEEELVVPFLQAVTPEGLYVANSLWVDYDVSVDGTTLRVRGSTDPAITDAEGRPFVVTEVKTTKSVDHLDEPRARHKAQLQAYLVGLNEEHDHEVHDGMIVYISRTTLDLKTFAVSTDPDYWMETVVPWMASLTTSEQDSELPPASPEQDWECQYCSYKHRCGEADTPYSDVGHDGLLPSFDGYSRENLVEYLEAHAGRDARLTPSLAHKNPDLASEYGALDWSCLSCGTTYEWDAIKWGGDVDDPPYCLECIGTGDMVVLSGPSPDEQLRSDQ